jgi:hypothetical protein
MVNSANGGAFNLSLRGGRGIRKAFHSANMPLPSLSSFTCHVELGWGNRRPYREVGVDLVVGSLGKITWARPVKEDVNSPDPGDREERLSYRS